MKCFSNPLLYLRVHSLKLSRRKNLAMEEMEKMPLRTWPLTNSITYKVLPADYNLICMACFVQPISFELPVK